MSASDWQLRPDDDLVEPLFGGLRGSQGESAPEPARTHRMRAMRRLVILAMLVALLAKLVQETLG